MRALVPAGHVDDVVEGTGLVLTGGSVTVIPSYTVPAPCWLRFWLNATAASAATYLLFHQLLNGLTYYPYVEAPGQAAGTPYVWPTAAANAARKVLAVPIYLPGEYKIWVYHGAAGTAAWAMERFPLAAAADGTFTDGITVL